jgi:hypothetical protein
VSSSKPAREDFSAPARHFATEKISREKKGLQRDLACINTKDDAYAVMGDGSIVVATGVSSRGSARVVGFRACAAPCAADSRDCAVLARGDFAQLCLKLHKGEFRNEFREIHTRA